MSDKPIHRFHKECSSDSPIPNRVISNEEFMPIAQTDKQARIEWIIERMSQAVASQLGMDRREFLKTSGGMAVALLAMNQVFGTFFDIMDVEAFEPEAFKEYRNDEYFIFDVQTHYVSSNFTNPGWRDGLLGLRRRAKEMGVNPQLRHDSGTMADLSWENFVKEVFLDSDTSVGLISTPPGPYPWASVVPPKEMTHIRDEINRVTGSQRMLAHGLVMPQLGQRDLDFMDQQAETLKVDAWKTYTGAAAQGFDHGWWLSDEKIAYPMLQRAQKLGVTRVCIHKGLPLGSVVEYNHPKDTIQAAKDFPGVDFLLYHSGFLGVHAIDLEKAKNGEVPWTSEFCRMKQKNSKLKNIYMEIGSTFAQLVITEPQVCAHLFGQMLLAFGDDHILWGTDSIWYGTPQWQIEAFRRFQIPDALREKHGYPELTKEVKAKIFGLNAARVFSVDVNAKRHELPKDYLSRLKMAYLDEGPFPSHRAYGWVVA
ncbi:MAG: amidohydrolase family protein [Nitrospirota bacterium]|nr:amidohydrolase family protein [Nitrospirota bacterium]